MPIRPFVIAENNWKAVQVTDYQLAILPWGATEAHNYHLPYATDNVQVEAIAIEAARKAWEQDAKVVVLPTIPFGVNTGQLDIKLCLNMNPSTQQAVIHDILNSLQTQGIKKLLILNGHGGNDFKQIIREMTVSFPDMFIGSIDWYKVMKNEDFFKIPGDHAGEMETSLMMYFTPEWVLPLSEAGPGATNNFKLKGLKEGWAKTPRKWTLATNDTGDGNPEFSSAEKGKKFFEAITSVLADFMVELAPLAPHDLYEKPG